MLWLYFWNCVKLTNVFTVYMFYKHWGKLSVVINTTPQMQYIKIAQNTPVRQGIWMSLFQINIITDCGLLAGTEEQAEMQNQKAKTVILHQCHAGLSFWALRTDSRCSAVRRLACESIPIWKCLCERLLFKASQKNEQKLQYKIFYIMVTPNVNVLIFVDVAVAKILKNVFKIVQCFPYIHSAVAGCHTKNHPRHGCRFSVTL